MDQRYCPRCGHVGTAKRKAPGSMLFALVLLLCFIVPGLLYLLWMDTHRKSVCRRCGTPDPIPTDSPMALAAGVRTQGWAERFFEL